MAYDEAPKNHRGGVNDKRSYEKEARIYETEDQNDEYKALELYLEKINPNCSSNAALHIHVSRIPCPNLYMMSRIATKRKYFNIRVICENLPAGCISALLPFHALTPVATQHPSYETIQRIQLGKYS